MLNYSVAELRYNTFALYNCTQFSKNYGKSFFRIEESGLTH